MLSFSVDPGAAGVGVAFSDRWGGHSAADIGPLNLGRVGVDDTDAVVANMGVVRRALGLGPVVTLHQVHGNAVLRVDEEFLAGWDERSFLGDNAGEPPLPRADAMVTALRTDPPVALCIRVADCVPVLLADPEAGVVGAAHAGRVGFAGGVLPATVAAMRELGARELTAWIGPHICGGCYEVPAAMQAEIGAAHPTAVATTTWGTPALDLGAGCAAELAGLGCAVVRVDPCTRTSPDLHSHRRDADRAGRLGAFVWLAPR